MPGKPYKIQVKLWPIDYLIPAGHRLRLALSLSDFPRVFPLPHQGKIHLHFSPEGPQSLALQVLPVEKRTDARPELAVSDLSILEGVEFAYEPKWKVVRDQVAGQVSVESGMSMEFTPMHMAVPIQASNHYSATVMEGMPETARLDADSKIEFSLEGNRYAATVHQRVTQSQIEISTRVEEAGDVIHEREFSRDYEV